MRVLYVSGTYAPGAMSGSELSAHTLLRELSRQHGVDVRVLSDVRYTGGAPGRAVYDGVLVEGTRFADRREAIDRVAAEFLPHVVFTQLHWADEALRAANARGLATVLRIASVPLHLDLTQGTPTAPTAIVAASRYVADYVWRLAGRGVHVMPPCIDLAAVQAIGGNRRLITMFNPIDVKGGDLFRAIAERLPVRTFAVVRGWSVLRTASGDWDRDVWDQSVRSQGMAAAPMPRETSFADLANVTTMPAREDVAAIYAQTRLLCVPSRWEEPFGRVVIEAYANGIPVIASAVGGLKEHASLAGVLIDPSAPVEAWITAIERLDDDQEYADRSRRGLEVADARFGYSATVAPFMTVLRTLAPEA